MLECRAFRRIGFLFKFFVTGFYWYMRYAKDLNELIGIVRD